MVFPIRMDAVEAAPTAVDFTIRNRLDAALFAAMAAAQSLLSQHCEALQVKSASLQKTNR